MEKVSVNLIKTRNPVYFIDEKEVKEIVKKLNPTKKIGDLNIPELEKKLNNLYAVDSANVYLNLNGNLNLDIKQKVPAFRLNKEGKDFYVDHKGQEFPTSKNYSFPCMLVMGDVKQSEYISLAALVDKIDKDAFSKKYFIGISKDKNGYNLLTSEGNYKVEIGDLERIDLKVKGFKTFVEKFLINQPAEKYTKISVKYDNQIVTTLNPLFKENDSMIKVGNKELAKLPVLAQKKADAEKKSVAAPKKVERTKSTVKKTEIKKAVPKAKVPLKKETTAAKKVVAKPKTSPPKKVSVTTKPATKPKGKVKIE